MFREWWVLNGEKVAAVVTIVVFCLIVLFAAILVMENRETLLEGAQ